MKSIFGFWHKLLTKNYFRLPVDIYQTAKVSKLLLMMEKGTVPVEYQGKSLSDINIDLNVEYVEEHDIEGKVTVWSLDNSLD